jgi:AcrR family transcriptional regulator
VTVTAARTGTKGVPRGEREDQILEAAAREFGIRGYAATSVASVAAAAGISKPLVYQYFGSKEGLHGACVEQVGAVLEVAIEEVARGDSVGLRRGMLTLEAMFTALDGRPFLWRTLFDATAPGGAPGTDAVRRHTAKIEALAREGVTELLALHGTPTESDISALAQVWLGIVDSFMTWWADHPGESAEDMAARGFRLADAAFRDTASTGG